MSTLRYTCLTLALLGAALPSVAQAPVAIKTPAEAQQPAVSSRQITFAVQAATSKGEAVQGLTAADFKLLDNKVQRPITALKELTAAREPVTVFLVIDTVNIDFTRVAYVRSEVQKYLATNGGKLAHPTTFVILNDKGAQIQQGFSTSGTELSQTIAQYPFGLRVIRRDTGFWGANERTQISLDALQQLVGHVGTLPGRKLILWISPGWPLLTGPRIQLADKQQQGLFAEIVQLSGRMRTAGVTLDNINPLGPGESLLAANYYQSFTKGVKKPSDVDLADLSLQVLSVQSGGRAFTSDSDVAGNIARSATDADHWYELTFDSAPAERPNEFHQIELDVDKGGTDIRTRNGYYAQP